MLENGSIIKRCTERKHAVSFLESTHQRHLLILTEYAVITLHRFRIDWLKDCITYILHQYGRDWSSWWYRHPYPGSGKQEAEAPNIPPIPDSNSKHILKSGDRSKMTDRWSNGQPIQSKTCLKRTWTKASRRFALGRAISHYTLMICGIDTFSSIVPAGKQGLWKRSFSSRVKPPCTNKNSRATLLWKGGFKITRVLMRLSSILSPLWCRLLKIASLFVDGSSDEKMMLESFASKRKKWREMIPIYTESFCFISWYSLISFKNGL